MNWLSFCTESLSCPFLFPLSSSSPHPHFLFLPGVLDALFCCLLYPDVTLSILLCLYPIPPELLYDFWITCTHSCLYHRLLLLSTSSSWDLALEQKQKSSPGYSSSFIILDFSHVPLLTHCYQSSWISQRKLAPCHLQSRSDAGARPHTALLHLSPPAGSPTLWALFCSPLQGSPTLWTFYPLLQGPPHAGLSVFSCCGLPHSRLSVPSSRGPLDSGFSSCSRTSSSQKVSIQCSFSQWVISTGNLVEKNPSKCYS